MRVIAYTFEADFHCPYCTRDRFGKEEADTDENGVPYDAEDQEGNPVNPVFSTDELQEGEVCGDCCTLLKR